jgi:AcrR family transcriptional regulator
LKSKSEPATTLVAPKRSGVGIARGLTRELLLNVAEEFLLARGADSFRVQDVSDRLQVRPAAIYNHFRNREDLISSVVGRLWIEIGEAASPVGDDPRTSLLAGVDNLVSYFLAKPRAAGFDFTSYNSRGFPITPEAEARGRETMAMKERALKEGVRSGYFHAVRLDAYLAMLYGGVAKLVTIHFYFDRPRKQVSAKQLRLEAREMVARYLFKDTNGYI